MSRRVLALAVLTGAALLIPAPDAGAAQSAGISSADAASATAVATAPELQAVLARFFAAAPGAPKGVAPVSVQVGDSAVAVYDLSPAFVAGTKGAAVGDFAYFAVSARASDGRTATVWSVRGESGWTVGNIASGDDEAVLAKSLPAGAQLLREPQLDAWYAVHDGLVTRLGTQPAQTVTLAAYQQAVAGRYADKLPGSAYAENGEAGGFGNSGQVMPRGDGGPAPESHDTGWLPLLILAGILLLSGAGYVLHLRRQPVGSVSSATLNGGAPTP